MGLLERARDYLAKNAAESGADVLIRELIEEVELWKNRVEAKAMTEVDRKIAEALAPLIAKAESGEDWAEIALREAEMIEDEKRLAEDNGQFGVGA